MGRKQLSNKGPRPTAQQEAEHRERMKRMQEFQAREREKQARFMADWRASGYRPMGVQESETLRQAGVPESPSGSATDADVGASPAKPSTAIRRVLDPQLGHLVAEIRVLPPRGTE